MHDDTPLVSIVMPTCNRADMILETIESIRLQTWRNWELLIVDDGSTDNTEELVAAMNDSRICFLKQGQAGMDAARNLGITRSNGAYIALIDSDDLWELTKLEKQVGSLREYPAAGFCLTGGYNFRERNVPVDFFYEQREGIRYGELFLSFFNSQLTTLPSALLFKKECTRISGLHREIPLAHVDFILRLAKNFPGVLLYEPLTFRRLHPANFSTLNQVKRHEDGIRYIRSFCKEVPKSIINQTLYRSHLNFGESCLKRSDKWEALRQFTKAWRYRPLSIIPLKKIIKNIF